MSSLWPDDLFEEPNPWEKHRNAPLIRLRGVGEELIKKSETLVRYEIVRRVDKLIFLDFKIIVPALDDYEFVLFTVKYDMKGSGYPAYILDWEGEEKLCSSVFSEFDAAIRQFLSEKKVCHVVGCLYFHAKNLSQLD